MANVVGFHVFIAPGDRDNVSLTSSFVTLLYCNWTRYKFELECRIIMVVEVVVMVVVVVVVVVHNCN